MNIPKKESFKNSAIIKKNLFAKSMDFRSLMQFRIRNILLVSSLYDFFIFEEDGRIYEMLRKEYHGLNLTHSPELIHCPNGNEAIKKINTENRYDLIIVTQHIEDMSAVRFAQKAKKAGIEIPIIYLGYDNRDMLELWESPDAKLFERLFVWQGDYKIILGIIKYIEDKFNVEKDTKNIGVQVIILVEDNIRFYSSYLPLIYTEVLTQSQDLISEGINLTHKFLRMRARPKILLCSNYEEAWYYFKKYEKYILGIISDIDFKRQGKRDTKAGLKLARRIKNKYPDIPVLLQSNNEKNRQKAYDLEAGFLLKKSDVLLQELHRFMMHNFGFGPFIFRSKQGDEVGRAANLSELQSVLEWIPIESVIYHSLRNHFSNWLKARTEFWLANKLRPRKVEEYATYEDLRKDLINSIKSYRLWRKRGVIVDYNKKYFERGSDIARIGNGSIGGKARGLSFVNYLLSNFEINEVFPSVDIRIPPTVIIGTNVFDDFLEANNLLEFALHSKNNEMLRKRFIEAQNFPADITVNIQSFLDLVSEPLAVRSSSLLEDSQGQPFAGVYETIMLPNNHPDIMFRLQQLLTAIKLIYASIFYNKSKDYIKVTSYRLEEEKMAVIIQKIVGTEHNGRYYPELSGVGKSINFYPTGKLKSSDGIVSIALGLGKMVVDGKNVVKFCPKYPQTPINTSTTDEILRYSQREFYAVNLDSNFSLLNYSEDNFINSYSLEDAEKDGTLFYAGSTYSLQNHTVYDGIGRDGVRVVTFAPILKHKIFPLHEILDYFLRLGKWGMGSEIEIEFAINFSNGKNNKPELNILQMRPLVVADELEALDLTNVSDDDLICRSNKALGNGVVDNIRDIVFIDIDKFSRDESRKAAAEITKMNARLVREKRKYLLIGVGRWGSTDPWLGIPVTWEQISNAGCIIESNFRDFNVTPSQGSHFFQNLTSFRVGYLTVDSMRKDGFIDWEWLRNQKVKSKMKFVNHVRFEIPLVVKINGQENKGIIIKPM